MKTLAPDHHTFTNSGWEQRIGFELNKARLEAIRFANYMNNRGSK